MKRIKLFRKAFSIGVFLFLSAVLWSNALAQNNAAREFLDVTVVTVKPEAAMDFERLIKTEFNPGFIKGGGKSSEVWQKAIGNAFEYIFVQPLGKFAEMDAPGALEIGLGKDGTATFFARASRMVSGVRSFVIQTRPDLSYITEMKSPPKFAVLAHIRVMQGRENDFENYVKTDWLPVVGKSGIAGYWLSKVILGGDINEYISLTLQENFAELDKGAPPARVLGQEGAVKLQQKLPAGTLMSLERYVIRLNPELSVLPSPATASK